MALRHPPADALHVLEALEVEAEHGRQLLQAHALLRRGAAAGAHALSRCRARGQAKTATRQRKACARCCWAARLQLPPLLAHLCLLQAAARVAEKLVVGVERLRGTAAGREGG